MVQLCIFISFWIRRRESSLRTWGRIWNASVRSWKRWGLNSIIPRPRWLSKNPLIILAPLETSLLMGDFSFQSLMDQYFGRMRSLTGSKELPARIRFLLQNTVELRANNWTPRKAHIDSGPKTIGQVRQEAVKVSPLPPPPPPVHTCKRELMFRPSAAGSGRFHSPSKRCDEKRLLHGERLVPSVKDEVRQGDIRRPGWHVWTNARYVLTLDTSCYLF